MNIQGKTILVTGASGGIGSAILKELAAHESTIFAHYYKNVNEIASTHAKSKIIPIQADFSDINQIKALFKKIRSIKEKIDVVVNAVGIENQFSNPLDTTQWMKTFQVNLFGVVECCNLAKEVINDGGVIINISSIMGKENVATPLDSACYSATKAALNKFTLNLAYSNAGTFRAVTISPGYTLTQMWDGFSAEVKDECINSTLIKRFIRPNEIAIAVKSTIENDAITAQDVIIDGGLGTKRIV